MIAKRVAGSHYGFLIIGMALALVTVLAISSITLNQFTQIQNKKVIRLINRTEGYYSGELIAWHSHYRNLGGLSPVSPGQGKGKYTIEIENDMKERLSLPEEGYEPSSYEWGTPLNVRTTLVFDSARSFIRRMGQIGYRMPASLHCGQSQFQRETIQTCLSQNVKGGGSGPPVTSQNISVKGDHICVIRNEGVQCWGENTRQQLGVRIPGGRQKSFRPVQNPNLRKGVSAVAVGSLYSMAILNGRLVGWGDNAMNQIGSQQNMMGFLDPIDIDELGKGVTSVSGARDHTCVVAEGAAKCFGDNTQLQLGNGEMLKSELPVPVPGLSSGVTQVAASGSASCVVVNGGVKCWGIWGNEKLLPFNITGLSTGVTFISISDGYGCAVKESRAMCWGIDGGGGRLGVSVPPVDEHTAVLVEMSDRVSQVAVGSDHSCALIEEGGGVKCWGVDNYGELGNGGSGQGPEPRWVSGMEKGVAEITAGKNTTCAMKDGEVFCWGEHRYSPDDWVTPTFSNVPVKIEKWVE